MKSVGLYLHIPFCHAKCGYCDFATFANLSDKIEPYLESLKKEISLTPQFHIETLFVGGGTPTVLNRRQIENLFSHLTSHYQMSSMVEATLEANPESATAEVLTAYFKSGMNRISFGLQTTDNDLLKEIDRLHTFEEFEQAYVRARQIGFKNVNIDLIFGLPGQTLEDWIKTLESVVALNPEHISAYALKVETGTKFASQHVFADDDLQADMYLTASARLKQSGYHHYEISNFARPGFESQHNLKYWNNADTLGIGLSSASYMNGERTKNVVNLTDYFSLLSKDSVPQLEKSRLTLNQQKKENFMLKLRLSQGVPEKEIKNINNPLFEKFIDQNLAFVEKGMYCLTPQGWLVSNQLFQTLL